MIYTHNTVRESFTERPFARHGRIKAGGRGICPLIQTSAKLPAHRKLTIKAR